MEIQLDFRSGTPIYVQIMEQIRRMVVSGELKPGDQLPTTRQLATDLRVNFNTVARAYRMLDEVGLISTQQGRGTYIWAAPAEESAQQLKQRSLEELTRHFLSEAKDLGFTPEEIRQAVEQKLAAHPVEQAVSEPESKA